MSPLRRQARAPAASVTSGCWQDGSAAANGTIRRVRPSSSSNGLPPAPLLGPRFAVAGLGGRLGVAAVLPGRCTGKPRGVMGGLLAAIGPGPGGAAGAPSPASAASGVSAAVLPAAPSSASPSKLSSTTISHRWKLAGRTCSSSARRIGPGAGLFTVNVTIALSLPPSTVARPNLTDVGSSSSPADFAFWRSSAASLRGLVRRCSRIRPCLSFVIAMAQLNACRRAKCNSSFSSAGGISMSPTWIASVPATGTAPSAALPHTAGARTPPGSTGSSR